MQKQIAFFITVINRASNKIQDTCLCQLSVYNVKFPDKIRFKFGKEPSNFYRSPEQRGSNDDDSCHFCGNFTCSRGIMHHFQLLLYSTHSSLHPLFTNSALSFQLHYVNLSVQPYLSLSLLPSSHPSLLFSLSSVYWCIIITLHLWLSEAKHIPLSSSPSHHLYLSFTLSRLNDRDRQ